MGELLRQKGKRGLTALMLAAARGHEAVVTLLMNNGADVNVCTDDGMARARMELRVGLERPANSF